MKFCTALVSILHICSLSAVQGGCNADDHHKLNNGYFVEGIAGFSDPNNVQGTGHRFLGNNYQGDPKSKMVNSTWAVGGDYPDGSLEYCTGMFCSETCKNDGCPKLIEGHTCSMVRFCYEEDSGSDVWKLPNEMALAKCDFSEATPVCDGKDGSAADCCNYYVEEDAELSIHFFASKAGCAEGQKAAVRINDYDGTGLQCYNMGKSSSRIKKCTCNFENLADDKYSTLSEPCHSEFIEGCLHHFPDLGDDKSCCDTETCVGHHKDYNHEIGRKLEDARKDLCMDDIPGRCLKSIGAGDNDCCTRTCSQCGTDADPWFEWASCDAGNATASTGECGYSGSHYSMSKYECDFSKCSEGDAWHPESKAFKNWMETADKEGWEAKMKADDKADDSHSGEDHSDDKADDSHNGEDHSDDKADDKADDSHDGEDHSDDSGVPRVSVGFASFIAMTLGLALV